MWWNLVKNTLTDWRHCSFVVLRKPKEVLVMFFLEPHSILYEDLSVGVTKLWKFIFQWIFIDGVEWKSHYIDISIIWDFHSPSSVNNPLKLIFLSKSLPNSDIIQNVQNYLTVKVPACEGLSRVLENVSTQKFSIDFAVWYSSE